MKRNSEIQNSKFKIHADWLIAFALAFAALALYVRTLAPDVVDADGGEFQFAAWNFGFVHPTGYPLFLILGGLFQHLVPFGNPAYRLNLFTALTGAAAVGAVYLAAREITQRRGAALIAAAAFAVTRTFWADASATEIYALAAFFVALLIYLAVRWHAAPSVRAFGVFCLALGFALTHHRAIILWVPAFAAFFFLAWHFHAFRFTFDVSRFLLFGSAILVPLFLYLYIPLRAPASPYLALPLAPGRDLILYDNSFAGFSDYILGRTFQSELRWDALSIARLLATPQGFLDQFGGGGVALGALGCGVMLWRRAWARWVLLAAGGAATILFAAAYHIGDIAHYYIPAYLAWAIWIGVGVDAICNLQFAMRNSKFGLFAIFVLATALQLGVNFPFADASGATQARAEWMRRLSAPIPANAILISNDRDEMMPLWYLQYVENTRRDLLGIFSLITPAREHANVARVTDSVLDAARPVFFIKAMPGIEIKYRVEPANGLWRVAEAYQNRAPQHASAAILAGKVRVLGYDLTREADAIRLAVYWSPLVSLDRDFTTFVHLRDARGEKIAQGNDHQPGGAFYPTRLWEAGETLRDEFVISLPPNLARGEYTLVGGMYAQPDGEALGEPVVIGQVTNDK